VCTASGLKGDSADDVSAAVELMHKVLKPVELTPEQEEHMAWPFRFKRLAGASRGGSCGSARQEEGTGQGEGGGKGGGNGEGKGGGGGEREGG
jgi:hypothetical protein